MTEDSDILQRHVRNWGRRTPHVFTMFITTVLLLNGCDEPRVDSVEPVRTGFVDRIYVDSQGIKSRYIVFVPHGYQKHTAAPAILFLHGAGQTGSDGRVQAERGLGDAIRQREADFPFITIFPQSQEGSWLAESTDGQKALAILDEVQKHYAVDPTRIYLTGYSMGGAGTWSLAAAQSDRFAAIVPICPGENPALADKLADMPCWCFQGDADAVATVNQTRRMLLAIKAAGGRPMYHEYPGVGHNCWDLTYANPDLYEWLLSQSRGEMP